MTKDLKKVYFDADRTVLKSIERGMALSHLATQSDFCRAAIAHYTASLARDHKALAALEPPKEPDGARERRKAEVRQALAKTRGNVTQAAVVLGVSRRAMYRLINDLEIAIERPIVGPVGPGAGAT